MAARFWRFGVATALALGLVGPADARAADDVQPGVEADAGMQPEVMLDYLMAEFAAQRGDTAGALAIYHRLARELKDPLIARRAVETAIRARAFGPALESDASSSSTSESTSPARSWRHRQRSRPGKARATLAQIPEERNRSAHAAVVPARKFSDNAGSRRRMVSSAKLADLTTPWGGRPHSGKMDPCAEANAAWRCDLVWQVISRADPGGKRRATWWPSTANS
jgi:hypothetical protein